MEERALRVLEFTKIREQLRGYAVSALGAEKCAALVPTSDLAEATLRQQETEEAPAAPPAPPADVQLLTEIRDLLKEKK